MSSFFHFVIPTGTIPDHVLGEEKPTCVVGLIGQSKAAPSSLAAILNSSIPGAQFVQSKSNTEIQCFYEGGSNALYLYKERCEGAHLLMSAQKLMEQQSHLRHHQDITQLKFEELKVLLWMFSVCHYIVLLHPSQSLDVRYVRLFRTVHALLQHFPPKVREAHPDIPLLATLGRVHQPRLLFVFQSNSASMHLPPKKGRHGFNQQCKRLGIEMENQIFHIFRKCRLLPKQNSRSLHDLAFLPPPNELREPCVLFMEGRAKPSPDTPASKHVDTALYYISQLSATASQYSAETKEESMSLGTFLKRNIKLLKNQALQEKSEVHIAPLCDWYTAAAKLHSFYCSQDDPALYTEQVPAKICAQLDPEGQFSEKRCQKAYPVATSAYMDSLPSHYTEVTHQRQLSHALHVLRTRAKGPAYGTYAARLREDCGAVWEDGRKGCESISLTGNGCVLPLHEEGTRAHSNRLRMRSACSCGRSISYRSDPFALEAANHEFYSSLSEKCCSTLSQHRTFGRPQLSWMICTLGSASGYQTTLGLEQPGFLLGAQFLLPWDLPPDEAWNPEPKNAWRGKRSARCYVGYEYECSKGHRFYCSAGGVPVKGSSASSAKENSGGSNVLSDMQLYTHCPSHTNKPLLGQLMRIVITSPEQVNLSLNLSILYQNIQINLSAHENLHVPGGKMTVVRLPYVYCDERDRPLQFDPDALLRRNVFSPVRPNRRKYDKK